MYSQIAKFMRPTWGPTGADRTQMGPPVGPMNFAIWVVTHISNCGTFLRVHWWIVESPPLFWHRMPYGSFIICMFWIRWQCQLTCAICRSSSWQLVKKLSENIMSYSMREIVFVCVSGVMVRHRVNFSQWMVNQCYRKSNTTLRQSYNTRS